MVLEVLCRVCCLHGILCVWPSLLAQGTAYLRQMVVSVSSARAVVAEGWLCVKPSPCSWYSSFLSNSLLPDRPLLSNKGCITGIQGAAALQSWSFRNLKYLCWREQTTFSWLLVAGFSVLMFDAIKMKECSKCLEMNTKYPNIWCIKSPKMPLLTPILVVSTLLKHVLPWLWTAVQNNWNRNKPSKAWAACVEY